MKFENISTEDDFREGQIRMAVLWEREDVERFSEFFKRDMVDVVHLISDEGVVGALLSPQLPSAEAGSDDVQISAVELKRRLTREMEHESNVGESYAVVALRGAIMIVDEMAGWSNDG